MGNDDENEVRLLLPRAAADRLTRRRFLGAAGATAGALFLAACGDSGKSGSANTGGAATTSGGGATTTAGSSTTSGAAATTAAAGPTSSIAAGAPAKADGDLFIYTWAEYHAQENLDKFGSQNKLKVTLDIYDSNEAAIAKLELAKGSSGYDMVIPTGAYIPQMVAKGLIQPLDLSTIPNFANLDPVYTNQPWDPGNKYSVCKDWGSTGWLYDRNTIKDGEVNTWADFIKVAGRDGVSGQVSVLAAPADFAGIYFWANGIDWTTEKKEDLDAAEAALLNDLVPHIKAFDSYPGINFQNGSYVLSQVWNGDARVAVMADPKRYGWGLGAPKTELWMDNYCVVAGAKHPGSAHAFINYMLDPANSLVDIQKHGYNTGLKGVLELAGDLPSKEIIFFTDAQTKNFEAGAVNSAQDRLVEIFNKAKAKAGA